MEKICTKEFEGTFPEERLFSILNEAPWYVDIAKYLVGSVVLEWYSIHQRRKLISDAKH